MTQQERLVALIDRSLKQHIDKSCKLAENIASDLLAEGLIVPPCKFGDTIYHLSYGGIVELRVYDMMIKKRGLIVVTFDKETGNMHSFYSEYMEKRYFLTREEAEAALKERSEP